MLMLKTTVHSVLCSLLWKFGNVNLYGYSHDHNYKDMHYFDN